jgi:hypothetical protein
MRHTPYRRVRDIHGWNIAPAALALGSCQGTSCIPLLKIHRRLLPKVNASQVNRCAARGGANEGGNAKHTRAVQQGQQSVTGEYPGHTTDGDVKGAHTDTRYAGKPGVSDIHGNTRQFGLHEADARGPSAPKVYTRQHNRRSEVHTAGTVHRSTV